MAERLTPEELREVLEGAEGAIRLLAGHIEALQGDSDHDYVLGYIAGYERCKDGLPPEIIRVDSDTATQREES